MMALLLSRRMKKICVRVAIDGCTIAVLIVIICIMQSHIVKPFDRGFFYNDESIRHPMKASQVNFSDVTYVGIFFNLVWITLVELALRIFLPSSARNVRLVTAVKHVRLLSLIGPWILLLHLLVNFFMGAGVTNLATDVPKFLFGRLRPYFFEICRANISLRPGADEYSYIDTDQYRCTGDPEMVREARLSFPSGHSSMATYFATYAVVYTYLRLKRMIPVRNILFTLSLLSYVVVVAVMSTRVNDHRHHWSDVLAGMLIGFVVAILTLTLFTELHNIAPEMHCVTKIDGQQRLAEDGGSTDMYSFEREQSAEPSRENV